ncbi:MAG: sugar ABC transporter ATP-binding protein [Candidatus Dormibacteria bacterium]
MTGPARSGEPVVQLKGIDKEFAGVSVLQGVDFDLYAGEVHALVGANGSGKSTLMQIVYGVHSPTRGTLSINGEKLRLRHPKDALRRGIAAVPQELPLVASLSVAENICFGDLPCRAGIVRWHDLDRRADAALSQVDAEGAIHPRQLVGSLGLASRQLVSIARALAQGAMVLILDEPTSSLGPAAVGRLHDVIDRLRSEGRAVAFISQRLDDIVALADRVTVLRDGRVAGRLMREDVTPEAVAYLMAGAVGATGPARLDAKADDRNIEVLSVEGLPLPGSVSGVTLSVHCGEVLGLAGLAGSGTSELLRALYGTVRHHKGAVRLFQHDVAKWPIRRRVSAGMGYLSGNRQAEGLVLGQPIEFNLTLALNRRARLWPLPRRRQARRVAEVIEQLNICPRDPKTLAVALSGGNQQKVVVGRWLLAGTRLWLLDDPTRGVDVHARAEIHGLIRQHVARGGGALVTSSDIHELLEFCDRLLVFSRGQLVAQVDPAVTGEDEVLALAGGLIPAA